MIGFLLSAIPKSVLASSAIAITIIGFYEGLPGVKLLPGIGTYFEGRVDKSFNRGVLAERLEWEKARRAYEMKMLEQQRQIDRIDTDHWRLQASQAVEIATLTKALDDERAAPDTNPCGPVYSQRVWEQLGKIGARGQ